MPGLPRLFCALTLGVAAALACPPFALAQDNPMAAPVLPAPVEEPPPPQAETLPDYPLVVAPWPPDRPGRRPVALPSVAAPPKMPEATSAPAPEPAGFRFRLPSFAVDPVPSVPQAAEPGKPLEAPHYPPIEAPLPPLRSGAAVVVKATTPSAPPSAPTAAADADSRTGQQGVPSAEKEEAPVSLRSGFALRVPVSPPDQPANAPEPEGETEGGLPTIGVAPQASSTEEIEAEEQRTPEPTLVEKQTDAVDMACLKPEVMALVRMAGEHFKGTPVITSAQRNRGRRGSYHRRCMAADFFIPGIERSVLARYLRSVPGAGGVGTYCHTKSVHIDIGEPRNWSQCGFRFRFALR